MNHVPYKGGNAGPIALLAGEIQTIFAPLIEVLPHIRAGTIKALAVCGTKRSPLVPGVPVISDLLPGYETSSWGGISAPANTPDDVTDVCVYRNMRYRFSTKTVLEDRLATNP